MYEQTVLYLTGTGTYPNFARYSGVSASIWGTVPDSTKGDSCELAVTKNQRARDARRLGFTPGGVGFTLRCVPGTGNVYG